YAFALFSSTDPRPTQTYTLSLHDALPISRLQDRRRRHRQSPFHDRSADEVFRAHREEGAGDARSRPHHVQQKHGAVRDALAVSRSEEHTSELQSPYDLVCRLLLEKKKQHT